MCQRVNKGLWGHLCSMLYACPEVEVEAFSSRPSLDSVFPRVKGWLELLLREWNIEHLESRMSPEPKLSFTQSSRLESVVFQLDKLLLLETLVSLGCFSNGLKGTDFV